MRLELEPGGENHSPGLDLRAANRAEARVGLCPGGEVVNQRRSRGVIDKQSMRHFDEACLPPIKPLKPEEIKAIREKEHVSQTVFANYPNVTSRLISMWERREKRPSGASLKLLTLVEKNGLASVT